MKLILVSLTLAVCASAGVISNANITLSEFGGSGNAAAEFGPGPGNPPSVSAGAQLTALTLGPARNGLIDITFLGGGIQSGDGAGLANMAIGPYSVGCQDHCFPTFSPGLPMAFELGVPFQVSVSANAIGNNPTLDGGIGAMITFQFSLSEASGAPVPVYDASQVPEPATWLLTTAGLALLLCLHRGTHN